MFYFNFFCPAILIRDTYHLTHNTMEWRELCTGVGGAVREGGNEPEPTRPIIIMFPHTIWNCCLTQVF